MRGFTVHFSESSLTEIQSAFLSTSDYAAIFLQVKFLAQTEKTDSLDFFAVVVVAAYAILEAILNPIESLLFVQLASLLPIFNAFYGDSQDAATPLPTYCNL